jgi:hypothetical protein
MALKKALLAKYKNEDACQLLYLVSSLKNYKNTPHTKKDDILDYCRTFDQIAQHCMAKGVLTAFTTGV